MQNNNLFIVNGRFGKDKGIGTTLFPDKSLIDNTLCSAESFEILHDFEIAELDPVFSDGHSFLAWSVKCNNKMNNLNSNDSNVFYQNLNGKILAKTISPPASTQPNYKNYIQSWKQFSHNKWTLL